LRQRALISNLRNFSRHRFLQEGAKAVNSLLVLKHIFISSLASFLD
jgi:hypothetical protein